MTTQNTPNKVSSIKVVSGSSVRLTIGEYGVVADEPLIKMLSEVKGLGSWFGMWQDRLLTKAIEAAGTDEGFLGMDAPSIIEFLDCLNRTRILFQHICKQKFYERGHPVFDVDEYPLTDGDDDDDDQEGGEE